jgi:hypothetical protein
LGDIRGKLVNAIDEATRASQGANPIPSQFRDVKLQTPSGKTDPTGVWFLRGDKPVFSNSNIEGARGTLGDMADELNNYASIKGKNAQGSQITTWYKPGEEDRAQKTIDTFKQTYPSDVPGQIKYHVETGRALGYPESSINAYVRSRFGDKPVDALYARPPGPYKEALSNYRDELQVQKSFEDGWNTYRNKQGVEGYLEDSPEALKAWMKTATPEQVQARQLGAVSGAFQKIGSARNAALAGESILRPEYNVDKLKILFGEEKGARMAQLMDDQHAQAVQNAKIVSGSKTAETTAALEGSKLPPVQPMNMLKSGTVPALMTGAAGTLGYLGLPTEALLAAGAGAASTIPAIATKTAQVASRQLAKSTNIELARRISETGAGRADTIMRMVAHPKVVRARNELQNPP